MLERLRELLSRSRQPEISTALVPVDTSVTQPPREQMTTAIVPFLAHLALFRHPNELTAQAYLASLGEHDRAHVEDFLSYARRLHLPPGIEVAVTAVGSTVRPESKRYHSPRDIDLRILNSASPDTKERQQVVAVIRDSIRDHLESTGVEFTEDHATVENRMVVGTSSRYEEDPVTGKRRWVETESLMPFMDWYNNDPSFIVKHSQGLPLQLSISGADNYDLATYLQKEHQGGQHFALLFKA